MLKYTTEIEIGDDPIEVTVGYEYEAESVDGWHEPRLPEDVNIYSVTDKDGNEVDSTPGHEEWLIDEILDHIHQKAIEYEQDKAEYQYEAWKERGIL